MKITLRLPACASLNVFFLSEHILQYVDFYLVLLFVQKEFEKMPLVEFHFRFTTQAVFWA